MALFFALGATCFMVGPFLGFAIGDVGTSIVLFVGAILFTIGGGIQTWLAYPERDSPSGGRAAWWTATVQSAGTLAFNVTTTTAFVSALPSAQYDRLVWRPDAVGSVFFLVSGVIAYVASPRHRWLPKRTGAGWWEPGVNLLGCIFFGISAIAGYVVPGTGSVLSLAASNWTTSLGAACFLACAAATLRTGHTWKIPSFRHELDEIEEAVEEVVVRDVDEIEEIL
jgi:hypothetical protein